MYRHSLSSENMVGALINKNNEETKKNSKESKGSK